MRIDNPHSDHDGNLISIAYEAHQRVIELILLFQDRLDKTKESILADQEKSFLAFKSQLKELETISHKMVDMALNNKATLEKIENLSSKIYDLENIIKDRIKTDRSEDLAEFLKELKPILGGLTGTQQKNEQVLQKVAWAFFGISVFINVIWILCGLGVIPMPWHWIN